MTLRGQLSLRLHRERENSWKEIKAFVRKEEGDSNNSIYRELMHCSLLALLLT